MFHHLLSLLEEAGGFDNDVNTQFAPGEVLRVALGVDFNFLTIDYDAVTLGVDFTLEVVVDGVVFEEVSQGVGACEVIDGYDVQLGVVKHSTEGHTSNSAETVNSNFCHSIVF